MSIVAIYIVTMYTINIEGDLVIEHKIVKLENPPIFCHTRTHNVIFCTPMSLLCYTSILATCSVIVYVSTALARPRLRR